MLSAEKEMPRQHNDFFFLIIQGLAYKLEVLENDHHLVLEMGRTIKHENKAQ